ncbi:MAG: sigma-70 family RNA polymerase sigma factor [Myxococcales bacterium]|nr:sigma-70 family RNA polymerase sigma factor [Myxococcales bacterium]
MRDGLFKHYRTRRTRSAREAAVPDEELDFALISSADLAPSASTALRVGQEMRLVLDALRHVPVECQEVLELHYWEQMDTDSIATVVGVPQGTVKSRLARGRRLLAERLAPEPVPRALLESALSDLDGWARSLRERLLPEP